MARPWQKTEHHMHIAHAFGTSTCTRVVDFTLLTIPCPLCSKEVDPPNMQCSVQGGILLSFKEPWSTCPSFYLMRIVHTQLLQ